LSREPESLARPRCVERTPGLPIGLRRVPPDLAGKAGQANNDCDEVTDGDLATGAQVHGLRVVIAFGGEAYAIGSIVDIEELSGRCPRAPHDDVVVASLTRVDALLDERRDHM
jgi:hypothetical protein